jgi:CrcB protein
LWSSDEHACPPANRRKDIGPTVMDELMRYFWIMLGGALGTAGRYWASGVVARAFGETFPWGTLIVNVSGSLLIGFFATLTDPDGRLFVGTTARQFVMIGICGGYTTFSSFSLQTLNLMNDGEWLSAGGNILLSVALCLLAVWAGHMFASSLNALKWT